MEAWILIIVGVLLIGGGVTGLMFTPANVKQLRGNRNANLIDDDDPLGLKKR